MSSSAVELPVEPGELVSLETVDTEFHVSRPAQYYKRRADLPSFDPTWPTPIRVGRRKLRYRRSELERWLEDNRVASSCDAEVNS